MAFLFRNVLIVGAGGFIGAVLRYLVSGWAQNLSKNGFFPVGTLSVNIAGCLLLGFLGGWSEHVRAVTPEVRLFLFIGILGSFTTYSTFSYETMALFQDGGLTRGFLNIGLHIIIGLGSAFLGFSLSRYF